MMLIFIIFMYPDITRFTQKKKKRKKNQNYGIIVLTKKTLIMDFT